MTDERPDSPDPRTDDQPAGEARLRAALDSGASSVDVDESEVALVEVAAAGRTRVRKRQTVLAAAGVAALVTAGAVVAVAVRDDSGSDTLATATAPPDTADEPTDTSVPDDDGAELEDGAEPDASDETLEPGTDPTDASPPVDTDLPSDDTEQPPTTPTVASASPDASSVDPSALGMGEEVFSGSLSILPWKSGFLAIGQHQAAQALPTELPEEISERFPEEVRQLFEDAGGLPPTIQEATTMLSEAGLLDEVTEILSNDPEVSEAIYSEPAPPTRFVAAFSDDGATWEPTDVQAPEGIEWPGPGSIASTGESLVVSGVVYPEPDPTASPGPTSPTSVVVASTSDLATWSVQEIELEPAQTPEDPSGAWQSFTSVEHVVASGDRWLLVVTDNTYLDTYSLIPDDVRQRLDEAPSSSTQEDETGLTVWIDTEPGDDPTQFGPENADESWTFTWEELGVDGYPSHDGPPSATMWAGSLSGDTAPTSTTVDDFWTYGPDSLVGTPDGFVRRGTATLETSIDGTSWTAVSGMPATAQVSVVSTSGGPIALAVDPADVDLTTASVVDEPPFRAYRIDITSATAMALPTPDIPFGWTESWLSRTGFVVSASDQEPTEVTTTVDTFDVRVVFANTFVGFEVTDADGTTVAEGRVLQSVGDVDGPIRPTEDGWSIDVDGRDAPLIVPFEDLDPGSFAEDDVYVQPARRLIATDGDAWLDVQLTEPQEMPTGGESEFEFDGSNEVATVAVNGRVAVAVFYDGSIRRWEF